MMSHPAQQRTRPSRFKAISFSTKIASVQSLIPLPTMGVWDAFRQYPTRRARRQSPSETNVAALCWRHPEEG